MTTPEALRATILEEPAEDTPRLVYADALDERAEGTDAARAAFIRESVRFARMEPPKTQSRTGPFIPGTDAWERVCTKCFSSAAGSPAWFGGQCDYHALKYHLETSFARESLAREGLHLAIGAFPAILAEKFPSPSIFEDEPNLTPSASDDQGRPIFQFNGIFHWSWSRGFVSHLIFASADFVPHVLPIMQAHPVERIEFSDVPGLSVSIRTNDPKRPPWARVWPPWGRWVAEVAFRREEFVIDAPTRAKLLKILPHSVDSAARRFRPDPDLTDEQLDRLRGARA